MKKIISLVALAAVLLGSSFAWASSLPIGGQTYYLAGAGVTSSQSTIQLSSMKTPDGRNVTMSMIGTVGYGALEPQTTAKIEDVTFTGITQNPNGTATLTGVSRGMDFTYPYTASTTLQKSHAGGATFIITNTAGFYYNEFTMQNNNNLFVWPTASTSPTSKGYVDYVAFNGAGVINADTSNRGVVQLATGLQTASSTATGSTGAALVIPSSLATSTYNSATAPLKVVVTQNNGTIDGNFLPTTIPNVHTFTGQTTFSATSTYTATSSLIVGAFPVWQVGKNMQVFSSPGTTTFSVPSGITKVNVQLVSGGGAGGGASSNSSAPGAAGGYAMKNVDVTGTSTIQVFVGSGGTAGTAGNNPGNPGTWSTFGTNGFYFYATGGGGGPGSGSGSVGTGGVGTNGDFNLTGGASSRPQTTTAINVTGVGSASIFGSAGAYGSGGDGCSSSGSTCSGAVGTQGVVIVSW